MNISCGNLLAILFFSCIFLLCQTMSFADDKTAGAGEVGQSKVDNGEAKEKNDNAVDISKSIRFTIISTGQEHKSHSIDSGDKSFKFLLSSGAAGAVLLSHFHFFLKTQPKGLSLSMDPEKPMISPTYDAESGKLKVMFNKTSVIEKIDIDLPAQGIVRFSMRQRDQMGFYVLSADRKELVQVWLGSFDYILQVPEFGQYKLCKDLTYDLGKKVLKQDDVENGIKVDALDDFETITVKGVNPLGKEFTHRYKVDNDVLETRMEECFRHLFRYMNGNTSK